MYVKRTVLFLALSVITSPLYTSYSTQAMEAAGQEESIDKRPTRVVSYTTRAMGSLLNQQHDLLGVENPEFLSFRTEVTKVITDPSHTVVNFFIVGSTHDLFLRVDEKPLDPTISLKSTSYTYGDLARALEQMDITINPVKGHDIRDDKVDITIKPKA